MSSDQHRFEPLVFSSRSEKELKSRAAAFLDVMRERRTVRDFANTPVPQSIIESAIATAGTAPSGANMQPWHFVAVKDSVVKKKIRIAAEEEERALYQGRASEEWLEALAPLGTDEHKPFLETAPWLVAVFAKKYSVDSDGQKRKHYYTPESVGIATGVLITALHYAGLATLTHTPSPMNFLREVLQRPDYEKPFLLLVVGYPAEGAEVPVIEKKPLADILDIY